MSVSVHGSIVGLQLSSLFFFKVFFSVLKFNGNSKLQDSVLNGNLILLMYFNAWRCGKCQIPKRLGMYATSSKQNCWLGTSTCVPVV